MDDTGNNPGPATADLSGKIDRLLNAARGRDSKPLSNAAAADAISRETGVAISGTYLWQLRTGAKTNPTLAHLRAIADFCGVPARYLVEEGGDAEIEATLDAGPGVVVPNQDVTLHVRGEPPRWRVTGQLRVEPSAGAETSDTSGGGGAAGAEPLAAAAEAAATAIAAWVQAVDRAVARDSSTDPAAYLPPPREIHVVAVDTAAAGRAVEKLVRRIHIA